MTAATWYDMSNINNFKKGKRNAMINIAKCNGTTATSLTTTWVSAHHNYHKQQPLNAYFHELQNQNSVSCFHLQQMIVHCALYKTIRGLSMKGSVIFSGSMKQANSTNDSNKIKPTISVSSHFVWLF